MSTCLLWFRRDLRLADNPALQTALDSEHTPVPVYIHDEPDPDWPLGRASAWWLHHSLVDLKSSLLRCGSDLLILTGDTQQQIRKLVEKTGAEAVYWNRCYEPAFVKRDASLKKSLRQQGIDVHTCNGSLLREPWQHLKKDGTPYRVFTPFWKALYRTGPSRKAVQQPEHIPAIAKRKLPKGVSVDTLQLLPAIPWDKAFYDYWKPGEDSAWQVLNQFSEDRLIDYASARDLPELSATSLLSGHLHFGEISPVQVWHYLLQRASTTPSSGTITATESYLRQVAWREFSHHLLYHFPRTALEPLDIRFKRFPWRTEYADLLQRWQKGQTGIPIADAGLRELWTTGYMHNRVRMISASFLTKNLLVPWQEGARWFWDTLVDADLANNTMGWQWTAGSGADASRYFRIFNPVLQGERFDKAGNYIRRWIPELATLNNKFIHKPWAAGEEVLADAGIRLGIDYPRPLVDLQLSRNRALAAWDHVKRQSS